MRPRPRSALRCRRDARQRACCREERAQGTGHRRATRTSACGAEMSAAVRERRALEGLMARTSVLLGMFAIAAAACGGGVKGSETPLAPVGAKVVKVEAGQVPQVVDLYGTVAREWKVVAPFAGRVAAKLVEVGDLAAPGRPLVMVESATGRRLVVAVPETVLAASGLKVGAPVAVRIDTQPGGGADGRVSEVYPSADPMSHAFTVKVAINGEVAAGVSGHAAITVGTRSAVAVPREALAKSGGLDLVVVRDAQGLSRSRAVTLGGVL